MKGTGVHVTLMYIDPKDHQRNCRTCNLHISQGSSKDELLKLTYKLKELSLLTNSLTIPHPRNCRNLHIA